MDQAKIGKFIGELRKEKKLKQEKGKSTKQGREGE